MTPLQSLPVNQPLASSRSYFCGNVNCQMPWDSIKKNSKKWLGCEGPNCDLWFCPKKSCIAAMHAHENECVRKQ